MTASRAASMLRSLLDLRTQGALFRWKPAKVAFLAASAALIVSQQTSFLLLKQDPDPFYRNVLNLGASYQRYFSFFYYFGGFPVNLDGQKAGNMVEAQATLRTLGKKLTPERNVYNRASIFLFYPDLWLKGRPDTAEMRTGLAIWFTLALLALFLALCYLELPLFGLLIALLCGSNPFQVYETYHVSSSTIFSTVISTGLMAVAICLLLSSERVGRQRVLSLLLTCVAGVICALQYEVRLEGIGVFIGAFVSLVVCLPQSKARKTGCLGFFLISALATSSALDAFFKASFENANQVVAGYGGTPAESGDPYYATYWWALWSGLGDFDEKYGFLADDRAGISYYYGQGAAAPQEQVLKQNYLQTILHDPGWFVGIVRARLSRVLLENTPYRIGFGSTYTDIHVSPAIVTTVGVALLLAGVFLHGRERLNLLILPLSVGFVSIAQLADYGLQFYPVAHLFIFAYVACCSLEAVAMAARRRWSARSASRCRPG